MNIHLNHILNQFKIKNICMTPPPQTPGLKNISLMQNTHMALVPKTTVVHSGWSCHSKQTFWRGVLESHCAVIIRNESIVDRVSFPATVEIFQMAVFVCYSAPTVTLWEPLKWVRFIPSRTALAWSRRTHDLQRSTPLHGNHRNKHDNNMRAEAASSVTPVQLTW